MSFLKIWHIVVYHKSLVSTQYQSCRIIFAKVIKTSLHLFYMRFFIYFWLCTNFLIILPPTNERPYLEKSISHIFLVWEQLFYLPALSTCIPFSCIFVSFVFDKVVLIGYVHLILIVFVMMSQFIFVKKEERYRNVLKRHICMILDSQWVIKIKSGVTCFLWSFIQFVSLMLWRESSNYENGCYFGMTKTATLIEIINIKFNILTFHQSKNRCHIRKPWLISYVQVCQNKISYVILSQTTFTIPYRSVADPGFWFGKGYKFFISPYNERGWSMSLV